MPVFILERFKNARSLYTDDNVEGVQTMGERIGKEKIKREPGYLYYVGKDGYVWAAPMKHNKSGKKKKVGKEKIKKEPGWMYYVGSDGYVYRARMKNWDKRKK